MTPPITWPDVVDQGNGPVMILIHPLGADHRYWDDLAHTLDGYRLIAYDLPGHGGRSTIPGGYRIEDLAEDLRELMDRLHLSSAILVGVSIGGLIVQAFAARYSERVTHAFMVDTVPVYPEDFAANLRQRADLVLTEGLSAVIEPTLSMWFTQDFIQDRPDITGLVESMLLSASPAGYAQACQALVEADLRTLAEDITCPCTVMCGTDDLPAFVKGSRWLHSQVQGSSIRWIEGGRHAAALECNEQFAAKLVDELGSWD